MSTLLAYPPPTFHHTPHLEGSGRNHHPSDNQPPTHTRPRPTIRTSTVQAYRQRTYSSQLIEGEGITPKGGEGEGDPPAIYPEFSPTFGLYRGESLFDECCGPLSCAEVTRGDCKGGCRYGVNVGSHGVRLGLNYRFFQVEDGEK